MQIEVLTPDSKVFAGEAEGVQMPAIDGLFEVLNGHAPLISALGKGRMRINSKTEGTKQYDITGGFVEVLNNRVVVLVEGAKVVVEA